MSRDRANLRRRRNEDIRFKTKALIELRFFDATF